MANFKGGFAFNNEAAKVEVEQSPNGALISCINPVTGESMGGGNPNSVQVITGTMASVWDDLPIEDGNRFAELFRQGGVSAQMVGDLTALGESEIKLSTCNSFITTQDNSNIASIVFGNLRLNNPPFMAFETIFSWELTSNGYIKAVGIYSYINGEVIDISEHASQIPTTLTIYWHPMPETEGE